jgi:hypothetical protein
VGGPPVWGLDGGLTTLPHKTQYFFTNDYEQPRNRTDYLAQPKHRKMDVRFGTWNVRSLYRSGDKTDCSNYRGISLLSTSYKI